MEGFRMFEEPTVLRPLGSRGGSQKLLDALGGMSSWGSAVLGQVYRLALLHLGAANMASFRALWTSNVVRRYGRWGQNSCLCDYRNGVDSW